MGGFFLHKEQKKAQNMISNIKENVMEKQHFTYGYSTENFDLHNISDPLAEYSKSKSKEHPERLRKTENYQKITKSEEI